MVGWLILQLLWLKVPGRQNCFGPKMLHIPIVPRAGACSFCELSKKSDSFRLYATNSFTVQQFVNNSA